MTPRRRRRILAALILLHLAGAAATAYLVRNAWPDPKVIAFLAMFLADASLTGLWAGLSRRSLPRRMALAGAGAGYLVALPLLFTNGYGPSMMMFATLAMLSLVPGFLVATALRTFQPKLRLVSTDETVADGARLQVSIRFLFAFTAGVAMLLMILQSVEKHVQEPNLLASLILPLSYGWICCVVALAALMPRKAGLSTGAAVALCSLVGVLPAHYLGAVFEKLSDPIPWVVLAGADAAIIAATLHIVRWCGYRLVPRAALPESAISHPIEA